MNFGQKKDGQTNVNRPGLLTRMREPISIFDEAFKWSRWRGSDWEILAGKYGVNFSMSSLGRFPKHVYPRLEAIPRGGSDLLNVGEV